MLNDALYLAIAAKGGGGGDFSTATLEVVNNTSDEYVNFPLVFPMIIEYDGQRLIGAASGCPGGTYVIPLCKDGALMWFSFSPEYSFTYDGNIEYDEDEGEFLITGDCSLTFSGGA